MNMIVGAYAKDGEPHTRSIPSADNHSSRTAAESRHAQAMFGARRPESFYRGIGKRSFDIVVASAGLVATAPLILILILLVWMDGGQPIFGHSRVGRGNRIFKCLKIRSMVIDAEQRLAAILKTDPVAAQEWTTDQKLTNDPRVTRIGGFLRKSSLDELPQLINVLRGDMSIVGPRPITVAEVERYGSSAASYTAVRPGVTGPWQVSGRNDISFPERVALDVGYVNSHSFFGDASLIAKTALSVLRLTGK